MLSQLRTGVIQLLNLSGVILSTVVPVASINGIGFGFKEYDNVWAAMDGALGAHVRGAIEKAGLLAFDKMWDNGYRQITSGTHPINTPDDFKDFKIRVPVSPLWTSMFRRFGATAMTINFSEVYNALKTKFVDGQENPLSLIEANKFYEVQKYVSRHQSHVGRVLDTRERPGVGHLAWRPAGHRCQPYQRGRARGARGHPQAQ